MSPCFYRWQGQLGVSVTELLEGLPRAVQEQRYSAAEVAEALIRRALAFPVEPPERQQARVQRYLPRIPSSAACWAWQRPLAVWMRGAGRDRDGAMTLPRFWAWASASIYGAYAFFWMPETLPRYYDENRIVCSFAQGAMPHPHPGRVLQQPQLALCAAGPSGSGPWYPCCCCHPLCAAAAVMLEPATRTASAAVAVFVSVHPAALFGCNRRARPSSMKKTKNDRKNEGSGNAPFCLLACFVLQ